MGLLKYQRKRSKDDLSSTRRMELPLSEMRESAGGFYGNIRSFFGHVKFEMPVGHQHGDVQ